MKLNFYYRSLAVSIILLMMSASVINAQDAANPWHLTAKENGKEVAFYNVEHITDVKATAQTVTVVLDNGKQFSHPIATTFGFDPRKSGTGTANEEITVPQWNVSYAKGRLNFSEPVSNIAVYSIMGTLVFKSAGIYTSVPVNLAVGVYVIQAGGKTVKLVVADGGFGGRSTAVQPVLSIVEPQAIANVPSPVSLQAGTVKIYWNITTSNAAFPVEIPEVEKFYFTPDNSIVFSMKNGTTVQLDDCKGTTFTTEPATVTNSKWDLGKTLGYCGATQDVYGNIYFSVADQNAFIIYNNTRNETLSFPISNINKDILDNPSNLLPDWMTITGEGHIGALDLEVESKYAKYGVIYPATDSAGPIKGFVIIDFKDPSRFSFAPIAKLSNGDILIKTTTLFNNDGSITIKCADSGKYYTFK